MDKLTERMRHGVQKMFAGLDPASKLSIGIQSGLISKAVGDERPGHKYIRREKTQTGWKYIYKDEQGKELEGQKPAPTYRLETDEHLKEIASDLYGKFPKYSFNLDYQGTGKGIGWRESQHGDIKVKVERSDLSFDASKRTRKQANVSRYMNRQEFENKIEQLMDKWYGSSPASIDKPKDEEESKPKEEPELKDRLEKVYDEEIAKNKPENKMDIIKKEAGVSKPEEITEDKFEITGDELRNLWGKGGSVKISGKEYDVHKMSYGDYFLEPKGTTTSEDTGFHKDTLFLRKTDVKKNTYKVGN